MDKQMDKQMGKQMGKQGRQAHMRLPS